MRSGHLFAACGGSLWSDLILGHEPVLAVEWDRWRCGVLEQRKRDGCWPGLEVVCADVAEWDATPWRGRVDILSASIPCPEWSTARRGVGDCPDLTEPTCRIIGEIRPRWFMLECVPDFAREHGRVRRLVAEHGYTLSRPLLMDGSAVGAPCERERYWALGVADDEGQPMCALYDEMAELSPPSSLCWDFDPRNLRVADGLADRKQRLEAVGDGVIPLAKAAAYLLLCPSPTTPTDKATRE